MLLCFLRVMHFTVKLNTKPYGWTIEIQDIWPKTMLLPEPVAIKLLAS